MDHVFVVLIAFLAFFNQAVIGFGASVTLVSLGALLFPIETILPAFLPVNVLLSFSIAFPNREHIQWRLLRTRVIPLMLLGAPLGMWLFDIAPERILKGVFGALVATLAIRELLLLWKAARKAALESPKAGEAADEAEPEPTSVLSQAVALVLGGVIHGAYSSGGPMIVYVTGRAIADKTKFRATMCTIWVLMNVILTTRFVLTDRYGATHALMSLEMLLALPFALGLGSYAHDRLPVRTFRVLVFVGLLLISVVLLVSSLLKS